MYGIHSTHTTLFRRCWRPNNVVSTYQNDVVCLLGSTRILYFIQNLYDITILETYAIWCLVMLIYLISSSGFFKAPAYSNLWLIGTSCLFKLLAYLNLWLFRSSGLSKAPACSNFWLVRTSGLFELLACSNFWLVRTSGFFKALAYPNIWLIWISGLLELPACWNF